MSMSDETRVISSHALTVDGMPQPQIQPLNLPTAFNGYRKDTVEQYVNGLETQIWNLQRQLADKTMVLDGRQTEIGKKEQEISSLNQQVDELKTKLTEALQASENPMQELGTAFGKEMQAMKNTYETQLRDELEKSRSESYRILDKAKEEAQQQLASAKETTMQMMASAQAKKQQLEQDCAKLKKETDEKVSAQLAEAEKQAARILDKAESDASDRLDKALREIDVKTKQAEQRSAELDANSRKLMEAAQQREETAQRNVADSLAQLRQLGDNIRRWTSESK